MRKLPDLTPLDIAGAVAIDPDNPSCTGCRHRQQPREASGPVCRRYPPVWIPPAPVQDAKGQVSLQPGGFSWPPAIVRCGEHDARHPG